MFNSGTDEFLLLCRLYRTLLKYYVQDWRGPGTPLPPGEPGKLPGGGVLRDCTNGGGAGAPKLLFEGGGALQFHRFFVHA